MKVKTLCWRYTRFLNNNCDHVTHKWSAGTRLSHQICIGFDFRSFLTSIVNRAFLTFRDPWRRTGPRLVFKFFCDYRWRRVWRQAKYFFFCIYLMRCSVTDGCGCRRTSIINKPTYRALRTLSSTRWREKNCVTYPRQWQTTADKWIQQTLFLSYCRFIVKTVVRVVNLWSGDVNSCACGSYFFF